MLSFKPFLAGQYLFRVWNCQARVNGTFQYREYSGAGDRLVHAYVKHSIFYAFLFCHMPYEDTEQVRCGNVLEAKIPPVFLKSIASYSNSCPVAFLIINYYLGDYPCKGFPNHKPRLS